MAQYKVLKTSFINHTLFQEGEFVEYDGEAADNLELVKKGSKQVAEVESDEAPVTDAPAAE